MPSKRKINITVLIGIILIGAVSRAPITAVGTLIGNISSDLNLSSAAAGMITTLPLLAFAFVSPFVTVVAKKLGFGRALISALFVLAIGILVRSFAGSAGVYAGTALMGVGIAFGNVLTPGIIKMKFPGNEGMATGVYVVSMAVFSGIAAAISVPFANSIGWKMTLFMWIVVAALTMLWWAFMGKLTPAESSEEKAEDAKENARSIYSYPMAWILAAYYGLQSLLYYCFVAWLPTILVSKGLSASAAGGFTTLNQMAGLPMAFLVPIAAQKMKNQKNIALFVAAVYFAGMFMLYIGTSPFVIGAALCLAGLGAGSSTSLATVDITLRAADGKMASALAGMSQFLGYILAASGPTLLGKIYDVTNSWSVPMILLLLLIIVMTFISYASGDDFTIGEVKPKI
ncbi:MAG: MFS transporter [Eubacterium sp.]|nr:MFS transporter [Eubacterium sp.]